VETTFDLIVIGGGPAGAACARRAAASGLSVVLFERAHHPRPKPCAGGLSLRALPVLNDLPDTIIHATPRTAEIVLSDATALVCESSEPVVVMTTRRELDAFLCRRARDAGARVVEGAVANLVSGPGSPVVEAAGREWRAPWLVAADGAVGRTRAALGLPSAPAGGAVFVRVHLGADEPGPCAGRAVFDLRAAPSGYGWVFPKRGHLSIGVYRRGPVTRELRDSLRGFLDGLGVDGRQVEGPFAFPVPLRAGPFGRGRVLLAGDAAGLADPITGEGVPHAVRSGRIAAECVAEAVAGTGDALTAYRGRIAREVVPVVNEFRALGLLVYALGPAVGTLARVPPARWLLRRIGPALPGDAGESLHVERPHAHCSQ